MKRFSVIVDGWSNLPLGQLMNAASIAVGGLKSDGFGERIIDENGNPHAAIRFNMPILKAKKPSDFFKVINQAKTLSLDYVIFCREAQALSNSFENYRETVQSSKDLSIVSMAIYGDDEVVRKAVKSLSVMQ